MKYPELTFTAIVFLMMLSALVVAEPVDHIAEQIVVTGTRTEKALEDSPVNIDVITAAELAMVSRGTIADALSYIPGVSVRRNTKDGFNILMQGFDGDRVLVLVDGQPVISPTGDSADLGQISALDVERIEVTKGAASVLYGSAAMGGVINIITREGQKDHLRLAYESGSYAGNRLEENKYRQQANVSAGLAKSQWNGGMSYQYYDNPGFEYDPDSIAQDAGEAKKNFAQARVAYLTGKHRLAYKSRVLSEEKYKTTGPFPGEGNNFYLSDVDQVGHDFSVSSQLGWEFKARYSDHDERSGVRTGLRNTRIENADIDAQYVLNANNVDWVGGLHYYLEGMDQKKLDGTIEVDDETRDGFELFAQADWYASNSVEIVAGIRGQHDSSYGNHSATRISTMWRKSIFHDSEIKWRTSLGQSYRVPTLKERFYFFDHSNLGYIVQGDDSLEPETSESVTTGVEYIEPLANNKRLRLNVGAHYSKAEDFINTEIDSALSQQQSLSIFVYSNIDEVVISGGDISIEIATPAQKYQLNYSYVDAENKITKNRLSDRPYHQVKANYWLSLAKYNVDMLFYLMYEKDEAFSQKQALSDDYLTLNFTINAAFKDGLSWKFGVENLLNDHRDSALNEALEFDPRPISSRYVFAGLTYQFDY